LKKILTLILLVFFLSTLFAGKIFYMKPIFKGIDDDDLKSKIERSIKKVFKKKYNSVSYKKVSSRLFRKLRKCGSDSSCWSDKIGDKVDYAALFLVKLNDDEEYEFRTLVLNLEDEEKVADKKKIFDDADEITLKNIYKTIKKATKSIYRKVKKKSDTYDDIDQAKLERERIIAEKRRKREEAIKRRREEEARRKAELKRQAEERRQRLLEERRKREAELERRKELEKRRRIEAIRRKKMEAEKRKKEAELERAKLEQLRQKREEERARQLELKKAKMEQNASKLSRAYDIVVEMCSAGKYNKAIKAIVKVSKLKCGCEQDAKIMALKTQLLNFNKIRNKILQGVKLLDSSLILDNLEAAKALDQQIVDGGTEFSNKLDKIKAIGMYARGLELEKQDKIVKAKVAFEKCAEIDPDKKECTQWLENTEKIAKKIYSKAMVMKNFNPTKAKKLFKAITKLVNADSPFYKKAEKQLDSMNY